MAYGHSEVCRVGRVLSSRYERWLTAIFAGFGYDQLITRPSQADFFRSTDLFERAIGCSDGAAYVATAAAIDLTLAGGATTRISGVASVPVDTTKRLIPRRVAEGY